MTRNWIDYGVTYSVGGWLEARLGGVAVVASPRLENLEGRLSLSGIVGNHIGVSVAPAIVGQHIGTGVAPAIQGNHIGIAGQAIQGNHIGYSMRGPRREEALRRIFHRSAGEGPSPEARVLAGKSRDSARFQSRSKEILLCRVDPAIADQYEV